MADTRRPLLRGRIDRVVGYESPVGGGGPPPRWPERDPQAHRALLLGDLDALRATVMARAPDERDAQASREIVAIRPAEGARLLVSGPSNRACARRPCGR